MKLPAMRFDKEAVLDFLLLHGEKFVMAGVAALALSLLWGGIDALRTKTARRDQTCSVHRDSKPPDTFLGRSRTRAAATPVPSDPETPSA
jgi:hypothetical protein